MLKNFLVLMSFVFTMLGTNAQDTTLIDFEGRSGSIPTDWSANDVTVQTAAGGYLRFESTAASLETPTLNLSNYENLKLSFEVARFGAGADGVVTVDISDDNGQSWTAQTFNSPVTDGSSPYQQVTDSAINVSGSQVKIRFTTANASAQKRLRDFKLTADFASTSSGAITYYTKSSGAVDELSTWGTNPDGSGDSPTDFLGDSVTYIITNNPNPLIEADWEVRGQATVIRVDGVNLGVNPSGGRHDLIFEGDFALVNQGTMDASCLEDLDFEPVGNQSQNISSDGDTIRCYNFYPVKNGGTLSLNAHLYAGNNIETEMTGNALFQNNDFELRLDDDLSFSGDGAANYDLSGQIRFTGEGGSNDIEDVVAVLPSIYIDVTGDARVRFRNDNDDTEVLTINGDFQFFSSSSRDLRFNDVSLNISGDMTFNSQAFRVDEANFNFNGDAANQSLSNNTNNRISLHHLAVNIGNGNGLNINGDFLVENLLTLQEGVIFTSEDNTLLLSENIQLVESAGDSSYVDGPLHRINTAEGNVSLYFPIGYDGIKAPLSIDFEQTLADAVTYTAAIDTDEPFFGNLGDDFFINQHRWIKVNASQDVQNDISLALTYNSNDILQTEEDLIVFGNFDANENWVSLGADLDITAMQIRTTQSFNSFGNGFFALGGEADLNAFDLVSPENNSTVVLEGNPNQEAVIIWETSEASADVNYTWLAGAAGDTALIENAILSLISDNDGADTSLTLTFEAIADAVAPLLDNNNTVTLSWTVLAETANEERLASSTFEVTFVRGLFDGEEDSEIAPFNLTAPADNTILTTADDQSEEVIIGWEATVADNLENVSYEWRVTLADVPDFENPLAALQADNDGMDNQLTVTMQDLHLLIRDAGLQPGDSVVTLWTVVASAEDNEDRFAEEPFTLTLIKGIASSRPSGLALELNCYPNPTTDYVYIESPEILDFIMILNAKGQVVGAEQSISSQRTTLDVSHLKPGLYFIRTGNNSGEAVQKLIKK